MQNNQWKIIGTNSQQKVTLNWRMILIEQPICQTKMWSSTWFSLTIFTRPSAIAWSGFGPLVLLKWIEDFSKSKGLDMQTAAISKAAPASSPKYFANMLAPKPQLTPINAYPGRSWMMCRTAKRTSSLSAAVKTLVPGQSCITLFRDLLLAV